MNKNLHELLNADLTFVFLLFFFSPIHLLLYRIATQPVCVFTVPVGDKERRVEHVSNLSMLFSSILLILFLSLYFISLSPHEYMVSCLWMREDFCSWCCQIACLYVIWLRFALYLHVRSRKGCIQSVLFHRNACVCAFPYILLLPGCEFTSSSSREELGDENLKLLRDTCGFSLSHWPLLCELKVQMTIRVINPTQIDKWTVLRCPNQRWLEETRSDVQADRQTLRLSGSRDIHSKKDQTQFHQGK